MYNSSEIVRRPKAIVNFTQLRRDDAPTQHQLKDFRLFEEPQRDDCEALLMLESATPTDMDERAVYQLEKYIELRSTGKITEEWIEYGEKHAFEIIVHIGIKQGFGLPLEGFDSR
jgi:hypothetical protein